MNIGDIVRDINPNWELNGETGVVTSIEGDQVFWRYKKLNTIQQGNINDLEIVSYKIDLNRTHFNKPRKIIKNRREKDRGAPEGTR